MTVLVDWQIRDWIVAEHIQVVPFHPDLINPNSLDLRLGNSFIKYHPGGVIDPYDPRSISKYAEPITADEIYIRPEDFILGTTLETLSLPPCIVGSVEGKSSLARIGLELHQTGGWIDAGFSGNITLEMKNNNRSPILLQVGMPIGQIVFHQTEKAESPYGSRAGSKYQGQSGATLSMYHKNKREYE